MGVCTRIAGEISAEVPLLWELSQTGIATGDQCLLPGQHPELVPQQLMKPRVVWLLSLVLFGCFWLCFFHNLIWWQCYGETYKAKALGRSWGMVWIPVYCRQESPARGPSPVLAAKTSRSSFSAEVGEMNPTGVWKTIFFRKGMLGSKYEDGIPWLYRSHPSTCWLHRQWCESTVLPDCSEKGLLGF